MPEIKPPAIKELTQKEKILALMCREPDRWFYPYEFMTPNLGAFFVGYKAPTRIAELQADNPTIFNKKSEDKYMQRQLNVDSMRIWYPLLKPRHRAIVDQYYGNDNND